MSTRLQATVSDQCMAEVQSLEAETGLSQSRLVEEALSLLATAAREAKAGHRVAFISGDRMREFISPALASLESRRERMVLSNEDFDRFAAAVENPPEPTTALRRLMRGKRR